ncbi:unnamed protein product [Toxocara canis]|uniref:Ovule protein n=1 Tax=Toxocara canis TaxID=6265 RepID=A0A183VCI1_TOXCA|nr:unnamed protein product [Toxocara canis]
MSNPRRQLKKEQTNKANKKCCSLYTAPSLPYAGIEQRGKTFVNESYSSNLQSPKNHFQFIVTAVLQPLLKALKKKSVWRPQDSYHKFSRGHDTFAICHEARVPKATVPTSLRRRIESGFIVGGQLDDKRESGVFSGSEAKTS